MKLVNLFSFLAFISVAVAAEGTLDCNLRSPLTKIGDVVSLIQTLIASHSNGETFKFPNNAPIIDGRRSVNVEDPTTFAVVIFESPVKSHPVTQVRAGFGQIIINCTEADGSTGGHFVINDDSYVVSFGQA